MTAETAHRSNLLNRRISTLLPSMEAPLYASCAVEGQLEDRLIGVLCAQARKDIPRYDLNDEELGWS